MNDQLEDVDGKRSAIHYCKVVLNPTTSKITNDSNRGAAINMKPLEIV